MPNQYCAECDKDFKSLVGFNGHNQWKHGTLPSQMVTNSPTARTTAMLERLSDQIQDLQVQMRSLRADNNGNGNGNNNGNGNGNENNNGNGNGNNQGNNSPSDEPFGIAVPTIEPEPVYLCEGRRGGCKTPVFPWQEHCPSCTEKLDWNGVDR